MKRRDFLLCVLAAMNNQMPIKDGVGGDGCRQQVGNNYASNNNPSTAMNHLLLGKKPLVNAKPRRGPHPGAIPPEVRKWSNNTSSRSSANKKTSEPLVSNVLDQRHLFGDNDTQSQNSKTDEGDECSSIVELGSSIQEKQKTAAMSVTHVACPQVII